MSEYKTTRKEAKESGEKYYKTNNFCKNGHLSHRFTNSGQCCECSKENHKKYYKAMYEKHGDKIRKKSNEYRLKNIEKIKEKKKKEYQENKQDILSKQKEYRLKNIDSIKQKQKEYYYSMTDEQKEKERTRLREYNRKAYKENPEKFRERARKFHHENKEKRLNYLNKWKEENQDKVIAYRQTSEYKEKGRFFTSRRRAKELTPQWANLEKIKEIYKNCPNGSHVDHIVPLFGKSNNVQIVCGLHCEDNLQYLEALENQSKNCFYWPDMP